MFRFVTTVVDGIASRCTENLSARAGVHIFEIRSIQLIFEYFWNCFYYCKLYRKEACTKSDCARPRSLHVSEWTHLIWMNRLLCNPRDSQFIVYYIVFALETFNKILIYWILFSFAPVRSVSAECQFLIPPLYFYSWTPLATIFHIHATCQFSMLALYNNYGFYKCLIWNWTVSQAYCPWCPNFRNWRMGLYILERSLFHGLY